jgi:excisionase family DNA binding protein
MTAHPAIDSASPQVPSAPPARMEPKDKLLFGKREAAAMLSISVRTLDRLLASGHIRHRRVGKKVLISRIEIEKFAKGGDVETQADSAEKR